MSILDEISWRETFGMECYGVKLGFRTDFFGLRAKLERILPRAGRIVAFENSKRVISLAVDYSSDVNGLYLDDEPVMKFEKYDDHLLEFIEDKILLILSLASLPTKFYIHAGAVVWGESGILLPGNSFAGKTTLVKEFIKAGAVYYSDDCVVLDESGNMLPFPRPLAIRTDEGRIFREAEYFGAKTGTRKARLDLILFAVYEKKSVWKPCRISKGAGILELIKNFFYNGSIGTMPEEILRKLTEITADADIWLGKRDEAATVVEWVSKNYKE